MLMSLGRNALDFLEPLLDGVRRRHRVLSGLLGDHQRDRGIAVQPRGRVGLLLGVLGPADIANFYHVGTAPDHGDFVELRGIDQAAQRAYGQFLFAGIDASRRHFHVLLAQRVGHVGDGHVVGAHLFRVHPYADLALLSAHDGDLPHARDVFEARLDLLVGDLGHLAQRPRRGHHHLQYRLRVRIELLHHRRLGGFRQVRNYLIHFVAHFLRGHVAAFIEREGNDHRRTAFNRSRGDGIDAAGGVDGVLHALGDFAFDLLGGSARIRNADDNGGQIDLGKEIEPQGEEGESAHHHQSGDEHGGENRPADTESSECMHG